MKENYSAIMQMILGNRGTMDSVDPQSDEWVETVKTTCKIISKFEKRLEDYPELVTLYEELRKAIAAENDLYAKEVYKEAFAFGLAIGQEVFDN